MTEEPFYQCAGCHSHYPEGNLAIRGLVRKKRYCETCVVEIDVLLKIRDDIHTEAAHHLEEDLLHEVRSFLHSFPKFELPDA